MSQQLKVDPVVINVIHISCWESVLRPHLLWVVRHPFCPHKASHSHVTRVPTITKSTFSRTLYPCFLSPSFLLEVKGQISLWDLLIREGVVISK